MKVTALEAFSLVDILYRWWNADLPLNHCCFRDAAPLIILCGDTTIENMVSTIGQLSPLAQHNALNLSALWPQTYVRDINMSLLLTNCNINDFVGVVDVG